MANPLLLPVLEWARRLRYPTLFKLTAGLFALTLFIPGAVRGRDPAGPGHVAAGQLEKPKRGAAAGAAG